MTEAQQIDKFFQIIMWAFIVCEIFAHTVIIRALLDFKTDDGILSSSIKIAFPTVLICLFIYVIFISIRTAIRGNKYENKKDPKEDNQFNFFDQNDYDSD